jgi:hypothetical protein
MAKPKQLTNEQAFRKLFKELNPIQVALLRERVVHIMEITVKNIAEEPAKWENNIIAPREYNRLNDIVKECIGFDR